MEKTLSIQSISVLAHLVILFLILGIPGLISLAVVVVGKTNAILTLGIALVASAPIYLFILYSLLSAQIKISPNTLTVKAGFYEVSIPRDSIEIEQIQRLDNLTDPSFRPEVRTNGIGLFIANFGWFESPSSRQLFMVQTRDKDLVYIPASTGVALILTPESSIELIDALLATE